MTLPPQPGIFAVVERRYGRSELTPPLRLFDGTEPNGAPLTLARARQLLYDRSVNLSARAALWHQIVERFRLDDGSEWPTAVVWLGLPGLRRTAYKIAWRFRAERGDVESELVTGYLEALAEVGAEDSDPGGSVLRSACSHAWDACRTARLETAVEDAEGVGVPIGSEADGCWEADYDPIPGQLGLSATVRITVPAHRVEGVRLGALAQAWGVAGTATSVGHSGRGRQVAKLSLRRSGRSR